MATDIDNMGHTRVAIRIDNGPAMKALAGRVKELRTHLIVVEESPEYEPESDGLAERCAQTVKKGLFITARSAREHRVGGQVPDAQC